ncbi:PspC domain-containing protein [Nocardioides zeae]|uniref:PspC domain-containing protein n=1 Tax=Nocardioides imazamoxiresistens TaxID=3231893 RepID=A0ABU3PV84_9ACTN|nr:PspC domain-containing protein [Nocardioides zeae]MDT9592791.1 PspC domain-containing protein [Nocardioides zeae]
MMTTNDGPAGPSGPESGHPHPTGPQPGDGGGPRVGYAEMRDVRRLRRTSQDRYVAGVAGGIARHFDVDPVVVRVTLAVLTLFAGSGALLYLGLWLLVPADDREQAVIHLDERSRTVAVAVTGGIAALALFGWMLDGWVPWPLLVVALVAALVLGNRQRRGPATAPPAYPASPSGPAYPAGPGYPPGPTGPTHQAYASGPATAGPTAPYRSSPVDPSPGFDATKPYYGVTAPPRPASPAKRGPVLFWFTLALAALAVGVLAVVDVAGAPVAGSAYPATALGVVGAMLLVGAFWGRAGGLILVGLVLTVATAGSLAAERVDSERRTVAPTTAAQVQDRYEYRLGETVIDLGDVRDPEGLADRVVDVRAGVGRVELVLPTDLPVTVDVEVGLGSITLPDQSSGGGGIGLSGSYGASGDGTVVDPVDALDEPAPLVIDVELGVGEVVVTR